MLRKYFLIVSILKKIQVQEEYVKDTQNYYLQV